MNRTVIVDPEKNGLILVPGGNIFIPISLGNHYYSSQILRRVIMEIVSKSDRSMIFLCDRLRFLSYQIRGERDIQRINSNVQIQLEQTRRALINLHLGRYPNALVADWSFCQEDPRYQRLLTSLEEFAREDPVVGRQLRDYAARLLHRFHGLATPDYAISVQLQLQYVMEETALSLFITEIRGYNVEVYRRGMGFVDYLYDQRPERLKSLMCKSTLDRKFIALEDWF
jgi:tRNA-dependent cyclodipeptide synthase